MEDAVVPCGISPCSCFVEINGWFGRIVRRPITDVISLYIFAWHRGSNADRLSLLTIDQRDVIFAMSRCTRLLVSLSVSIDFPVILLGRCPVRLLVRVRFFSDVQILQRKDVSNRYLLNSCPNRCDDSVRQIPVPHCILNYALMQF